MDFASYRKHLLLRPEGEIALLDLVRNFSRWFFDLLRNFVLVGGLKYFYEKSGSTVLFYLHQVALLVILAYCISYAEQWYINLFGFLENKRLAHGLNRAVNVGIAVLLFAVMWWGASNVVAEISHAQLF